MIKLKEIYEKYEAQWVAQGNRSRIVRDTALTLGDRVELIDEHRLVLRRSRRPNSTAIGTVRGVTFAGSFEGYSSRPNGGDTFPCFRKWTEVDVEFDNGTTQSFPPEALRELPFDTPWQPPINEYEAQDEAETYSYDEEPPYPGARPNSYFRNRPKYKTYYTAYEAKRKEMAREEAEQSLISDLNCNPAEQAHQTLWLTWFYTRFGEAVMPLIKDIPRSRTNSAPEELAKLRPQLIARAVEISDLGSDNLFIRQRLVSPPLELSTEEDWWRRMEAQFGVDAVAEMKARAAKMVKGRI
jgi:hypothetical protein